MLVRVLDSPYRAVKRGARGRVVRVKFVGSSSEVWRVRFESGEDWGFRPDELVRL